LPFLYTDDFNRADGAPGANWTAVGGSWLITSNKLTQNFNPGTANNPHILWATAASAGDEDHVYVQANITKVNADTRTNGLLLKYVFSGGNVNGYMGSIRNQTSATDIWQIYKFSGVSTGPTFTLIAQFSEEFTNGGLVRFKYDAGTLTLDLWSGSAWVNKVTTPDTTYAGVAGKAGVRTFSNEGPGAIDNFEFGSILAQRSIAGTVTVGGSALSGVTMTASVGSSASTSTDGSGNYTLSNLIDGSNYTITPTKASFTFTPTSRSFNPLSVDQTSQNFVATPDVALYTASGTVTLGGSPLAGVTVTLSGDSSGSTTTDGSGNWSIGNLAAGGNFTFTPTLTGYNFSPLYTAVTSIASNTTGVSFAAYAARTYTAYWSDTFGAGGPSLSPDWAGANFVVTGNKAVPSSSASDILSLWDKNYDNRQYGPDVFVRAVIIKPTVNTQTLGLVARYHDITAKNFYEALVKNATGTDQIILRKCVEGTYTTIQTVTQEWVDGSALVLECIGNTLTVYVNDVLVMTETDAAFQEINGQAGIHSSVNTSTGSIDNWSAGIPTGYTNLVTGPTIGMVSDTVARVGFRTSANATVTLEYSTASNLSGSTVTSGTAVTSTTDYTGMIEVTGLAPSTQYYFRLLVDGVAKNLSPYGTFTTRPVAGTQVNLKFVFGSCHAAQAFYGSINDSVYSQVLAHNPAFWMVMGDLIYSDYVPAAGTDLTKYRAIHRITQSSGSKFRYYQDVRRRLPGYTMVDDHDFTNDFSDGALDDNYAPGKQSYQEYIGNLNPDPLTSGELYYTFTYGNIGFFMLDQRTFRSPNAATDNSSKTILGSVQKAALKSWLTANNDVYKFKIICSPTSAHGFGTTANDGWGTGFSTERNEIWEYIRTQNIKGAFILSADEHWPCMAKNVYNGVNHYECGASSYNQAQRPETVSVDPAILYKTSGGNYYGVLEANTTVSPATVAFKIYSAAGSLLHTTSITETDISPPIVSAGSNQSVPASLSASLAGAVTHYTSTTVAWTKVSGPGSATFGTGTATSSTVSVSVTGDYLFRLTATNATSSQTGSSDVLVSFGARSSGGKRAMRVSLGIGL
jgi:alkaline phosphatase D